MSYQSIDLEIQARYTTIGDENNHDSVWLVTHGYGQLAKYFIRHFHFMENDVKVIAPEGLHRFYLNNGTGRVGASWMTKDDREKDIATYINMINRIVDKEVGEQSLVLLGFSQGAATICRWLAQTDRRIKALILWAGAWPHDVDISFIKSQLKHISIYIVVGDQDEYLGDEGIDKYLKVFDEQNIAYQLIRFDGKHQMHKATLQSLFKSIEG